MEKASSRMIDWRTLPKEEALLFFYGGRVVKGEDVPFFRAWEQEGLLRTSFAFKKKAVVAYLTLQGCALIGKTFEGQRCPLCPGQTAKVLPLFPDGNVP